MSYRQPRSHFAGLGPSRGPLDRDSESSSQLYILGISATVFDDSAVASSIDQGAHLQPHPYEPSLLVDRYDGRLLLDDLMRFRSGRSDLGSSSSRPVRGRGAASSSSEEEYSSDESGDESEGFLNYERFKDLKLRVQEEEAEKAYGKWCMV
eukprot:gene1155-3959_t